VLDWIGCELGDRATDTFTTAARRVFGNLRQASRNVFGRSRKPSSEPPLLDPPPVVAQRQMGTCSDSTAPNGAGLVLHKQLAWWPLCMAVADSSPVSGEDMHAVLCGGASEAGVDMAAPRRAITRRPWILNGTLGTIRPDNAVRELLKPSSRRREN